MSQKLLSEGDFSDSSGHYALIVSRWNSFIVENLKDGALETLKRHGIADDQVSIYYAPGAFEFPLVAKKLAETGKFDAVITLGAVIRGGTPHFEFVAGECARGLSQVSLETGVPVTFGVLTVDNIEQAEERSGPNPENKGIEATSTALEMVSLLRRI